MKIYKFTGGYILLVMPVFLLYDQNLDRQISILTEYGCEKIVKEKFTGTIKDRKGLHQLFDMLRNGDTVVVEVYPV